MKIVRNRDRETEIERLKMNEEVEHYCISDYAK